MADIETTEVVINHGNPSTVSITLGEMSSEKFIMNTALMLLLQCRDTHRRVVRDGIVSQYQYEHDDADYLRYINVYANCSEDYYLNQLITHNALILFSFVQYCVTNQIDHDTLYWLRYTENECHTWELIPLALEAYTEYLRYSVDGSCHLSFDFTMYNDQFVRCVTGGKLTNAKHEA